MSVQLRSARGTFNTTQWTLVLACRGNGDTPEAQRALAELFEIYWYPLYAYVRRRGYAEHDAQDLVQSFCLHLQETHALAKARQARGKFRSFLLGSLQNFLGHHLAHVHAQKRGGGAQIIHLDAATAEARFALEPAHEMTAEAIFEKRWAHAVLEQTLRRLRDDFLRRGKQRLFDSLASFLTSEAGDESYQAVANRLDLPVSAIKTTVHRMRLEYRTHLREEIARTVCESSEVDDELRHLRKVLASAA